jgi:hypothetical protein
VVTRVDGHGLQLQFNGLEVNCWTTSVVLDNEQADADLVTFGDVIAGNDRTWFFTLSALPDYGDGSLWELLWSTPAYTPIPYFFNPLVTAIPSPSLPWFTGECVVDTKPPIGGDAGSAWSFDVRLTCTDVPTRVTDGGEP